MKVVLGRFDEQGNQLKEIRIDPWDAWSADATLASIIAPVIKQLRDNLNGYPAELVVEDDPDGEIGIKKWEEILDKIIWSFEEVNKDWEDQFYSGTISFEVKEDTETGMTEWITLDSDTFKWDKEAYEAHFAKIQEGIDLFAKYFFNLWD